VNGTTITNTATLSNSKSASATMGAANVADVFLLKNVTTAPQAGVPLSYQITVMNAGPNDAANTVVTDTLPTGTSLVEVPSGCTSSGQTLTCALGNLAVGATQVLKYLVTIPDTGGTFTNLAVATSDTEIAYPEGAQDSVTEVIPGLAHTGAPRADSGIWGTTLVAAGVALLLISRRRRHP